MLRLSLSGHLDADPGYYQARRTLLDFRRMCHKQPRLVDQWRMFQYQFDGHYHQGPFSKLVQTFSQLGWSLAQIPFFSDEEGLRHDLLGMPSNLLVKILDRSWLAYVAVCHRHRQTMRDMHGIEPSLAMLDHDKLSAIDQSRVGAIQSGAFLCADSHSRFDRSQSGLCPQCAVADSVHHRLVECPRFQAARSRASWVVDLWPVLPVCLTHHLLPPACPVLRALRSRLHGMHQSVHFQNVHCEVGQTQHLFTDGSCLFTETPDYALAAWAVIHANSNAVLVSEHLGGLLQTIPRAELTAILAAIQWTIKSKTTAVIWSDAQYVVEGVLALQADGSVDPSSDNSDLWHQVAELLALTYPGQISLRYVPSHLDPRLCEDGFEDWLVGFNSRADTMAVQCNLNRDWDFAELHASALRRYQHTASVIRCLRTLFFEVAELTLPQTKRHLTVEAAVEDPPVPCLTALDPISETLPITWRVRTANCGYLRVSLLQFGISCCRRTRRATTSSKSHAWSWWHCLGCTRIFHIRLFALRQVDGLMLLGLFFDLHGRPCLYSYAWSGAPFG